jgi:hypothetical protein
MFASDKHSSFLQECKIKFFFQKHNFIGSYSKEWCDSLPNVNVPNDNCTACFWILNNNRGRHWKGKQISYTCIIKLSELGVYNLSCLSSDNFCYFLITYRCTDFTISSSFFCTKIYYVNLFKAALCELLLELKNVPFHWPKSKWVHRSYRGIV